MGDLTIVGNRGATLSGGQKARICLARAAYWDKCGIVILDDPLGAVDPEVANRLFDSCICGFMKQKVGFFSCYFVFFCYHNMLTNFANFLPEIFPWYSVFLTMVSKKAGMVIYLWKHSMRLRLTLYCCVIAACLTAVLVVPTNGARFSRFQLHILW